MSDTVQTPTPRSVDADNNLSPAPANRSVHAVRLALPRFAMVGLVILILVGFSIALPDSFGTWDNFRTVLVSSSVLTLVALAVSVPLVANDFDLSVASVLGYSSILAAGLPSRQGMSVAMTIVVVLAVGAAIGAIHALFIVRLALSPVIVTLASSTILTGLTLWYTGGRVLYDGIPESLTALGGSDILGVPLPVVYMIVIVALVWFLLSKRPWGRYLYAIGASEPSARLAGVRTGRVRAAALVLCSTLCAFAGIVLTAYLGSGNPTISNSYFLPAFAAAFLSLAAFKLGFFNPLGVVFSVYLLAFGVSGLSLLGAPFWVEPVFDGAALLVALLLARMLTGASLHILR
jgi:ribose transport system permease protein